MLFLTPNHVKAPRAIGCWFVNTILTHMDISQHIAAIYQQPSARCKPKPPVSCKNCSCVCCAQLSFTIQHRTVLIIVPLILLRTIIIAQTLCVGRQGLAWVHSRFLSNIRWNIDSKTIQAMKKHSISNADTLLMHNNLTVSTQYNYYIT